MVQTRSQLRRKLQCVITDSSDSVKGNSDTKDKELNVAQVAEDLKVDKLESQQNYSVESHNSELLAGYSSDTESLSGVSDSTESDFVSNLFKNSEFSNSLEPSSPDTPFGPLPLDLEPLESRYTDSESPRLYPSHTGRFNFKRTYNGGLNLYDYSETNSLSGSSFLASDSSDYLRQRARKFYKRD